MRIMTGVLVAVVVASAVPARAGSLGLTEGKIQWQSTRCPEPVMPASLLAADSETSASGMNTLLEDYNAYAGKMQEYMNCVSDEGQGDAISVSQSIVGQAQDVVQAAQGKVSALLDTLETKH